MRRRPEGQRECDDTGSLPVWMADVDNVLDLEASVAMSS